MNKKTALATLIEASLFLADEDRLRLLDLLPGLNDHQVETLGKLFAEERKYVLEHEDDIRNKLNMIITHLEEPESDAVYIGTGKPS